MMISPEYYRETIKDYTLEQLFKERDELLKEMRRYRRYKISPEKYQMALHQVWSINAIWNIWNKSMN